MVRTDTSLSPLDAARDYVRRGWRVVPVPYKQKRPILKEWEQLRLTESDLPHYFNQPANIGLILGEHSGWLVDVDLDCVEARALASKLLPATSAKSGRTSDPDDVPAPPDAAITQPGDLWLLGAHRLLCGDSSKPADLDRLLDGAAIHLANTDPPYNVRQMYSVAA